MPEWDSPAVPEAAGLRRREYPPRLPRKGTPIHRIFHRSTETHDRQRANHTQRQYHIACDTTDDQCGYHQNRHKGNIKAAAIQHTAVGFLIYIEDKQPDYERCPKQSAVSRREKLLKLSRKLLLKTSLNVIEILHPFLLSV